MKRIPILILCFALLLAGLSLPAVSVAEDDHPITLTITCDPVPELEGAGTIPDMLFTMRNTGTEDYTMYNVKLSGGYENDQKEISDDSVTILAGGTKEFHLTDVPIAEEQLDREITYRLEWEEHETVIDEMTGEAQFLKQARETTASITIERFVTPELSVSASTKTPSVHAKDTFKVTYTIRNDTAFDMTGLKLYDSESSTEPIQLKQDELSAGESISVKVTYEMGETDMTFEPRIEYIARRREMVTRAQQTLTVESVVVDLTISSEMRPATAEGTVFAVTVRNNGNRTVTDICVFDEIYTQIEDAFSLGPDEYRTLLYTVLPAVSSDRLRTVQFHVTAVDNLGSGIRVDDTEFYEVVPFITSDEVELHLYAVLQSPYYDKDKKLCASIQFIISNKSNVKIYRASLKELTLFGEVTSYSELRHGDTYFTQIYQLDGVNELRFRVDAYDPAGEQCSSDTVRLDLSGLKELADKKTDPVYVYTQNVYLKDLDAKYTDVLRIGVIVALIVAAVCAIVCVVLYAFEIRIRNELPGEFEEDMERAIRATKRRTEKQLFSDAPTEQFGYTAPIKLRNYGELTEEEAKARRELYEKRLRETLRKEATQAPAQPKPEAEPVRIDIDGTRVMPVVRRPKTVGIPAEPPVPVPEPEPIFTPVVPDIPEPEPEPEPIFTPVVPKPEPEPVPIITPVVPEPEPEPIAENVIPESAPEPEPEPIFTPVVPDVPEPEPAPAPEPEAIFTPVVPQPEPESMIAPVIPDVPTSEPEPIFMPAEPDAPIPEPSPKSEPAPETEPEPIITPVVPDVPAPEPEPEPVPIFTPVIPDVTIPDPEPIVSAEPKRTGRRQPVAGPRRMAEKETPAKRAVVLHPIRRMNG